MANTITIFKIGQGRIRIGTSLLPDNGATVVVDMDNPAVRRDLAHNAGRWMVMGGGAGAESPLVLTGNDALELPLTVAAGPGGRASGQELFTVNDDNGNPKFAVDALGGTGVHTVGTPFTGHFDVTADITDQDGAITGSKTIFSAGWTSGANNGVVVDENGQLQIGAFAADNTPLTVRAAAAQTANLLEVYDANSALVFAIHADGTVHIKTGGTIHADL